MNRQSLLQPRWRFGQERQRPSIYLHMSLTVELAIISILIVVALILVQGVGV